MGLGGQTMRLSYPNGVIDSISEPNDSPRDHEARFLAKCRAQWDVDPMQFSPLAVALLEYVSNGVFKQFEYTAHGPNGSSQTFQDGTVVTMRNAWRMFTPDIDA